MRKHLSSLLLVAVATAPCSAQAYVVVKVSQPSFFQQRLDLKTGKVVPNSSPRYVVVQAVTYTDYLSLVDGGYSVGPVLIGSVLGAYRDPVSALTAAYTLESGGTWAFSPPLAPFVTRRKR